ncbi:hypothetical protein AKO1_000937 [Acrasis kona]|uniref:Uncharacterized protein n=1 Tax=Acrasis kona TaxID=1008807 RepID=A0AAW2ZSY9_9EUKA
MKARANNPLLYYTQSGQHTSTGFTVCWFGGNSAGLVCVLVLRLLGVCFLRSNYNTALILEDKPNKKASLFRMRQAPHIYIEKCIQGKTVAIKKCELFLSGMSGSGGEVTLLDIGICLSLCHRLEK